MKLKWIMFWLDCPQIRWEFGNYEYVFWVWMRRKGEMPNKILYLTRWWTDGAWEENYPNVPEKKWANWTLWGK